MREILLKSARRYGCPAALTSAAVALSIAGSAPPALAAQAPAPPVASDVTLYNSAQGTCVGFAPPAPATPPVVVVGPSGHGGTTATGQGPETVTNQSCGTSNAQLIETGTGSFVTFEIASTQQCLTAGQGYSVVQAPCHAVSTGVGLNQLWVVQTTLSGATIVVNGLTSNCLTAGAGAHSPLAQLPCVVSSAQHWTVATPPVITSVPPAQTNYSSTWSYTPTVASNTPYAVTATESWYFPEGAGHWLVGGPVSLSSTTNPSVAAGRVTVSPDAPGVGPDGQLPCVLSLAITATNGYGSVTQTVELQAPDGAVCQS